MIESLKNNSYSIRYYFIVMATMLHTCTIDHSAPVKNFTNFDDNFTPILV